MAMLDSYRRANRLLDPNRSFDLWGYGYYRKPTLSFDVREFDENRAYRAINNRIPIRRDYVLMLPR